MSLTRRALLETTGATLATASFASRALADWVPSQRYPDPAIEVLDPKFERLRIFSAAVERIATGMRWSEGPVWFGDGRYLLWSDIPNNRIMKWEEASGAVSVFREPSNYANGNCRDREGRLGRLGRRLPAAAGHRGRTVRPRRDPAPPGRRSDEPRARR